MKRAAISIARNVTLVVVALVFAVLAGEALLRIVYGGKFGKRPGFFVPDAVTGWAPVPNLNHTFYGGDFSIEVITDADGTRLGRLGPIPPGTRLVLFCGDSNAFSWGVSTDESCASYLDEMVSARTGGTMRVVNLGVGGYGTLQTQNRLQWYLAKHPRASIAAVIMAHAPNDPVDNILTLGYGLGLWDAVEREKPRSRWHLVNFLTYLGRALDKRPTVERDDDNEGLADPYVQDMLFAFDRPASMTLPAEVVISDSTVVVTGLTGLEQSLRGTFQSGSFSPRHKTLVALAVRGMNEDAAARNAPVLHTLIPTMKGWVGAQVEEMIQRGCNGSPARADIMRRNPDPTQFDGSVQNTHSGGHFTPEFNREWARVLDAWLLANVE